MKQNIVTIKCPTCGEPNYKTVDEHTFKCNVCNTTFFTVDEDIEMILSEAHAAQKLYNFEKADELYCNILSEAQDEKTKVMCYFGRLLAYLGVVYIKDFNDNYIVTFTNYEPSISSIKEISYYEDIKNSGFFELYKEQLEEINSEYQKIAAELAKDPLYDVFICTKISTITRNNLDALGFTEDSDYADRLYDELKSRGLKVFYSKKTLTGIDYDAQIYSALLRSKNLLIVTTSKEYLESAWVQSEWRRWIKFIKTNVKTSSSLYLFIPDGRNVELPLALRKTQKFNDTLDVVNRLIGASTEIHENQSIILSEDNKTDIVQAITLFEEKRYDEARIKFEKLSDESDADALYYLGEMYFNGLGVVRNRLKALSLWEQAKELNHQEAEKKICISYLYGYGVKADENKVYPLIKQYAEDGHSDMYIHLAYCIQKGLGVDRDNIKAFEWYRKAAAYGDVTAEYQLGFMYYKGLGTTKDIINALRWLEKASLKGHVDATYLLGKLYYNEDETKELGYDLLSKAASLGHVDATYLLGKLYYNEDETKELGYDLLSKAASLGHVHAKTVVKSIKKEKRTQTNSNRLIPTLLTFIISIAFLFIQFLFINFFDTLEYDWYLLLIIPIILFVHGKVINYLLQYVNNSLFVRIITRMLFVALIGLYYLLINSISLILMILLVVEAIAILSTIDLYAIEEELSFWLFVSNLLTVLATILFIRKLMPVVLALNKWHYLWCVVVIIVLTILISVIIIILTKIRQVEYDDWNIATFISTIISFVNAIVLFIIAMNTYQMGSVLDETLVVIILVGIVIGSICLIGWIIYLIESLFSTD